MHNSLITALLLIMLCIGTRSIPAQEHPPLTHNLTSIDSPIAAPELALMNIDDELIDLRELQGKVVVVNFWATWCPPCRREMGSMQALYEATREHGVEILAVNIGEDLDTVFSFLGLVEPSPTFQMLFDSDASSMDKWSVKGLPTTYIIDPKGMLAYRAVGGRDFNHPEIRKALLDLGDWN